MLTAKNFRWLPNALTITRMLLAPAVCYAAASNRWVLGFLLLAFALLTDFFDGLAAKKLRAITPLGRQLDRFADATISGGGLIGLAFAGLFPWWGVIVAPIIATFVAEERLFVPKKGLLHRWRPVISVSYMLSVWVYISWMYAAQAFGWSWWYVVLTFSTLALSASLKRHRIHAWVTANKS